MLVDVIKPIFHIEITCEVTIQNLIRKIAASLLSFFYSREQRVKHFTSGVAFTNSEIGDKELWFYDRDGSPVFFFFKK